jgi:flagellar export protein FliJ
MKAFSFRLDSILNYRKYLEKETQRELYNAWNDYRDTEKTIEKVGYERVETSKRRSEEGLKGIDVPRYQMYRAFLAKLNHDLETAHLCLKKAEQKVQEREMELKKKVIERKMLEILKGLQWERYLDAFEREEQKEMDELVILRRKRKS